MESPAEPPADRAELNANARRPWFQYSLKTLLWFMTGCAFASAVLGWIGPEWGLAVLIGSPHIAVWTLIVTWRALSVYRRKRHGDTVTRALIPVVWAMLLYFVLIGGAVFGRMVIETFRSPRVTAPIFEIARQFLWWEFISIAWYFFFAVFMFVVAAASASFVCLILVPWGARPKTMVSLIGGATGSLVAFAVYSFRFPLRGGVFYDEPIELFAGGFLPIAMGFIFPPLFIAWADRLGRVRPYHETLDAPPPGEVAAAMRSADRIERRRERN